MDKIYSRKRIKIPKVQVFYKNNKNAKKFFSIFIIIFIAILTFYSVFKSINPIFDKLCLEKTMQIGTNIINNASNVVLDNIDYSNIVSIEKDEKNNILKTDVVTINKIASDIALEVQKQFDDLKDSYIYIPIGSLSGNKYLSGIGPKINIKVAPIGNVITQIKNEFESKGINQTVYRVYLELTCNVSVNTPYKNIESSVVNQILLVETVLVGNVPETFYDLEAIPQDDVLEVMQ